MKFVAVVFLLAVASVNSETIIENFDSEFETKIASNLVSEFDTQVNRMVTRLAATMVRVRNYQRLVPNRLDFIRTVPRTISGEFDRIRKHLRNQITIDKIGRAYTKAYNDFHDTIRARVLKFNNEQTSDALETCWIDVDLKAEFANSYFYLSSALGYVVEDLSAALDVIDTRIEADLIKYIAIFKKQNYRWQEIAEEVSSNTFKV